MTGWSAWSAKRVTYDWPRHGSAQKKPNVRRKKPNASVSWQLPRRWLKKPKSVVRLKCSVPKKQKHAQRSGMRPLLAYDGERGCLPLWRCSRWAQLWRVESSIGGRKHNERSPWRGNSRRKPEPSPLGTSTCYNAKYSWRLLVCNFFTPPKPRRYSMKTCLHFLFGGHVSPIRGEWKPSASALTVAWWLPGVRIRRRRCGI